MRIIGKVVRTLVLTALAIVAVFNSLQPAERDQLSLPSTPVVVDSSFE